MHFGGDFADDAVEVSSYLCGSVAWGINHLCYGFMTLLLLISPAQATLTYAYFLA
jgi:hypothetical protein